VIPDLPPPLAAASSTTLPYSTPRQPTSTRPTDRSLRDFTHNESTSLPPRSTFVRPFSSRIPKRWPTSPMIRTFPAPARATPTARPVISELQLSSRLVSAPRFVFLPSGYVATPFEIPTNVRALCRPFEFFGYEREPCTSPYEAWEDHVATKNIWRELRMLFFPGSRGRKHRWSKIAT
jgi:hypothetical protein